MKFWTSEKIAEILAKKNIHAYISDGAAIGDLGYHRGYHRYDEHGSYQPVGRFAVLKNGTIMLSNHTAFVIESMSDYDHDAAARYRAERKQEKEAAERKNKEYKDMRRKQWEAAQAEKQI